MAETWLVVGLGNPGPRYEATRHNVGQLVVDELAARRGEGFKSHKANARVAETWLRPGGARQQAGGVGRSPTTEARQQAGGVGRSPIEPQKLVLAKPNSFMNVSGGPVAGLARFFDVAPERVIVVHDELDIPFDTIKLKVGGSPGGHNGVRDVAKALGTPEFPRVRVGIGRPPGRQDPADWVLDPFGSTERQALPSIVGDAADAVEQLIGEGLVAAQQRYHAPRA